MCGGGRGRNLEEKKRKESILLEAPAKIKREEMKVGVEKGSSSLERETEYGKEGKQK